MCARASLVRFDQVCVCVCARASQACFEQGSASQHQDQTQRTPVYNHWERHSTPTHSHEELESPVSIPQRELGLLASSKVCVCTRACVRACVRVRVSVCLCVLTGVVASSKACVCARACGFVCLSVRADWGCRRRRRLVVVTGT